MDDEVNDIYAVTNWGSRTRTFYDRDCAEYNEVRGEPVDLEAEAQFSAFGIPPISCAGCGKELYPGSRNGEG